MVEINDNIGHFVDACCGSQSCNCSSQESGIAVDNDRKLANIGVVGLAAMGSNLARNLAHKGNTVAVYNRHYSRTETLINEHGNEGEFIPAKTIAEFVQSLQKPRTAIIMVKAGKPTDAVVEELVDAMEEGDIIVDGGNSYFPDTIRREKSVRARGLHFVGCGISGGEEGALKGPSMMPGGTEESWETLGPILRSIAAVAEGEPCVTHIGENGAGHFVKMVHNGIEYADMQLIAESYDLMHRGLAMSAKEISEVFTQWNKTELNSYLIEITADVLQQVDVTTGKSLVDVIVDQAGMKGTGTWTVQTALSLGVPVTGIAEAVFARGLSSQVTLREQAIQEHLEGPSFRLDIALEDRESFIENIRQALYASKIIAYAQGFNAIQQGAQEYNWAIDLAAVARIWRGGCIIRAQFLNRVAEAYESGQAEGSLLFAKYFTEAVNHSQDSWRKVVSLAAVSGVPIPAFSSSLAYYDGLRSERLPACLIQAQRDFFGAHTYRRVDKEGTFHTLWAEPNRPEVEM